MPQCPRSGGAVPSLIAQTRKSETRPEPGRFSKLSPNTIVLNNPAELPDAVPRACGRRRSHSAGLPRLPQPDLCLNLKVVTDRAVRL